jgi:hypothetical protein
MCYYGGLLHCCVLDVLVEYAPHMLGGSLHRWCVLVSRRPPPLVPSRTAATSTTGACSRSGSLLAWRRPHLLCYGGLVLTSISDAAHFSVVVSEREGGIVWSRSHGGKDKMKPLRVGLRDVRYKDAMTFHES